MTSALRAWLIRGSTPTAVTSEYLDQAMAQAVYHKLDDGTFAGRIPSYKGVIVFGGTLREREDELRSTWEDWMLVGLKLAMLCR
jgi:UPF0150-like